MEAEVKSRKPRVERKKSNWWDLWATYEGLSTSPKFGPSPSSQISLLICVFFWECWTILHLPKVSISLFWRKICWVLIRALRHLLSLFYVFHQIFLYPPYTYTSSYIPTSTSASSSSSSTSAGKYAVASTKSLCFVCLCVYARCMWCVWIDLLQHACKPRTIAIGHTYMYTLQIQPNYTQRRSRSMVTLSI